MLKTAIDTILAYAIYTRSLLSSWRLIFKAPPRTATQHHTRHLILITWAFPPNVSGGVYRPLSFVKAAVRNGWRVTVICGPGPDKVDSAGDYLASQIPVDVDVIRIERSHLEPGYTWFPRVDGGFLNALTLARQAPAITGGQTVVLASGPTFASFVAGYFLSKKLSAPLVLDYRDEWTQCPFDFVTIGPDDEIWEKRCLHHAELILVATRSFGKKMCETFAFLSDPRIVYVPNGFDPTDFDETIDTDGANSLMPGLFSLSYLGYLAEHIDPDEFIETFEKSALIDSKLFETIRLNFIGKRDAAIQKKFEFSALGSIVIFSEQVTKREATAIMRQSGAVLLFNPPRLARYIPGKLFDYIASGARILVYGEGGEVEQAVRSADAGEVVAAGDSRGLLAALRRLQSSGDAPSSQARLAWLESFDREKIANKVLETLDSIKD